MSLLKREDIRILAVVCLGSYSFINSFGSINIAIPTIQREFDSSLAAVQWISFIGLVLISSLSLGFGRLGDLVGRKRLYKLGMALYAVGAGLAVLVQSFPQLLYARGVMASAW